MTKLFHKRKGIDNIKKLREVKTSTLLILEEAKKRGIKWEKVDFTDLIKLKYKDKVQYFHARVPSKTTALAVHCCNDKRVAKNILKNAGLAVSKGYLIKPDDDRHYLIKVFNDLQKPLVVKPLDASLGDNVHLNIETQQEYFKAIEQIYKYYGEKEVNILVEEMFVGDEYRILATREKILSVIKRVPANVTGDGKSTIEQLIQIKNQDPIRKKIDTYEEIIIDDVVNKHIKKQNLSLNDVIENKKTIFLRPHSPFDIGFGGDTVDVTDKIHPSVKSVVQTIMDNIPGLFLTGIDYMTKDITKQQTLDNYRIIEINGSPFLDWNEFPLQGPRRRVAYEFLKIMFPDLE